MLQFIIEVNHSMGYTLTGWHLKTDVTQAQLYEVREKNGRQKFQFEFIPTKGN